MNQKIVFVRAPKVQEKLPWQMFHFDAARENDKSRAYDLVYFDFAAGKRKTWRDWVPVRGKEPAGLPDSTELPKVKSLLALHGDHAELGLERGTFLDFYTWVKGQPQGSIACFHLFSHGYDNEPIIWDESEEGYDDHESKALPRHPNDTEPRRRDFFGQNPLAGVEGTRFAAAFAPDAVVKVWGCNYEVNYQMSIRNYIKTRSLDVRETILDLIDNTWPMMLANLLGVTVWAPPVGWGTNPYPRDQTKPAAPGKKHPPPLPYREEWPPNLKKNGWWMVSAFDDESQRVFRDDFGARIDPTRYVGYHRDWVTKARRMQDAAKALQTLSPKDLKRQLEQRIEELKKQVETIGL
jgi:hypothetical protein